MAKPDVSDYLPLSSAAFEVMLTLSAGEQHGYRIMQDIADRSGGMLTLHAGTFYRTLARLLEQGLIEELDERPAADVDDERRRYYRLTSSVCRSPARKPAGWRRRSMARGRVA